MSNDYKKPFIPIWMDQAGFTPHQFRVLCHLWSRGQGRCYPSMETIATCCKINLKTAKRTIKELESHGFIERRKRKAPGIRFSNEYILTGPKGTPVKNEPAQKEPPLTGPKGTPPNRPKSGPGNDTSLNDTSLKRSKETKETGVSIEPPVLNFPSTLSKDEQLANLSLPKRKKYPTEEEFDSYVESAELDQVVNGRPYLWDELKKRKWHHWNEKRQRWEPIKDWMKYISALDVTMQEACER